MPCSTRVFSLRYNYNTRSVNNTNDDSYSKHKPACWEPLWATHAFSTPTPPVCYSHVSLLLSGFIGQFLQHVRTTTLQDVAASIPCKPMKYYWTNYCHFFICVTNLKNNIYYSIMIYELWVELCLLIQISRICLKERIVYFENRFLSNIMFSFRKYKKVFGIHISIRSKWVTDAMLTNLICMNLKYIIVGDYIESSWVYTPAARRAPRPSSKP